MNGALDALVRLAIGIALVLPVVLLARHLLREIAREHNEAWRAYAGERGFSFTPSRGFWMTWRAARIEGTRGGVPVVVDCYFQRVGRGPALFTRVVGPAGSAGEAVLEAFPRHDAHLRACAGGLELTWPGFEVEPAVLDAACELVTARG